MVCRKSEQCLLLTLIFALFPWVDAFACVVARPGTFVSLYELVPRSRHIALVTVECADDEKYEGCEFNDIETLRAPPEKGYQQWSWRIRPLEDNPLWLHSDFMGHTLDTFWQEERSRSPFFSCTFQHDFEPGQTYLIFYDMPAAAASAELIIEEDDAWLAYVRKQVPVSDFMHMPIAEISILPMSISGLIAYQSEFGHAVPAFVEFRVERAEEILYESYSQWVVHSRSNPQDPGNLAVVIRISQLSGWLGAREIYSVDQLSGRLLRVTGMLDRRPSTADSQYGHYALPHLKAWSSSRIQILD